MGLGRTLARGRGLGTAGVEETRGAPPTLGEAAGVEFLLPGRGIWGRGIEVRGRGRPWGRDMELFREGRGRDGFEMEVSEEGLDMEDVFKEGLDVVGFARDEEGLSWLKFNEVLLLPTEDRFEEGFTKELVPGLTRPEASTEQLREGFLDDKVLARTGVARAKLLEFGVKEGFDRGVVPGTLPKGSLDKGVIPGTFDRRAFLTFDMGVMPEILGGAMRPVFLLRRLPFMIGPCLED